MQHQAAVDDAACDSMDRICAWIRIQGPGGSSPLWAAGASASYMIFNQISLHQHSNGNWCWRATLLHELICLTSTTIPTGRPECVHQQKMPRNPIRFHLMDINGSPKVDLFSWLEAQYEAPNLWWTTMPTNTYRKHRFLTRGWYYSCRDPRVELELGCFCWKELEYMWTSFWTMWTGTAE